MKNYLSISEIRKTLDNKGKEYRNIHNNGYTELEKNSALKGMAVVRSIEKELVDRAERKNV